MANKPKITLEAAGRDQSTPWTDDKKPMPLLYRVVMLNNCMKPQVGTVLTTADVDRLLDGREHDVVIKQSKERR